MRVIMRSTAHRYPRGRLARTEQSRRRQGAWATGEKERRKVKRGRRKSRRATGSREKEKDEVARRGVA